MSETIMALVPFTVARQRFMPMVFAHCFSNSLTTFSLDHTPLLNVFNTVGSSVSGFHMGHFDQLAENSGCPPRITGLCLSAVMLKKEGDDKPVEINPTPAMELFLMNDLREMLSII